MKKHKPSSEKIKPRSFFTFRFSVTFPPNSITLLFVQHYYTLPTREKTTQSKHTTRIISIVGNTLRRCTTHVVRARARLLYSVTGRVHETVRRYVDERGRGISFIPKSLSGVRERSYALRLQRQDAPESRCRRTAPAIAMTATRLVNDKRLTRTNRAETERNRFLT